MIRLPKPGWMFVIASVWISCHHAVPAGQDGQRWIWDLLSGLPQDVSFRGMSIVNDSILWVSGNRGTILVTEDAGQTWKKANPAGNIHRDFRAIHAWNSQNAVAMAVGDTGLILGTKNGGLSWDTVYLDVTAGVFLDDIALDGRIGWCYGDPIGGSLYLLTTVDSGQSWSRVPPSQLPVPVGSEGAFAASGTNVVTQPGRTVVVTGAGLFPRFLKLEAGQWSAVRLPLQAGPVAGAYSVAFRDDQLGIAVGGNFQDSTRNDSVACMTRDGGNSWELIPESDGPGGYRSCVAWHPGWQLWFTTGRTGLDWSTDGIHWQPFEQLTGYYVCMSSPNALWCVGRNGRLGRLTQIAGQ